MEVLFLTDTSVTLAEYELSMKTIPGNPVDFAVRRDEAGVFEYVPSNFCWKVKEPEGFRRRSIWVSALGSNGCVASPSKELLVFGAFLVLEVPFAKAQLKFKKSTWEVAERVKHGCRAFAKPCIADEMEP